MNQKGLKLSDKKKIKYKGIDIEFEINPNFLIEILQRSPKVLIDHNHKMIIVTDNIEFVVALTKSEN